MKYFFLIVSLSFLSFTFKSDVNPGWYKQVLPRTDVVISDIFFLDSLNGWSSAANYPNADSSLIFNTTNGGEKWQIQYKNKNQISGIRFVNLDTGYAIGSTPPGIILKTVNGGTNWNVICELPAYPLTKIRFVTPDIGWLSSDDLWDGGIFKTTNGGINWVTQLDASYKISRFHFTNKDDGWAISARRSIYKTTNGGNNWNNIHNFPFNFQLNDLVFFNDSVGIASGGGILRTTNGGLNWSTQSPNGGMDLDFADDSVGWAGYNLFSIEKTTNGGLNWFSQITNASNPHVSVVNRNLVWAAGSSIVHTSNGGVISSVNPSQGEAVSSFNLFQNYPNPFNPNTIINYQLPKNSFVSLNLYDANGRLIKILESGFKRAGNYSTNFSAEGLSSGIYYYSLYADGVLMDTKKAVVLK